MMQDIVKLRITAHQRRSTAWFDAIAQVAKDIICQLAGKLYRVNAPGCFRIGKAAEARVLGDHQVLTGMYLALFFACFQPSLSLCSIYQGIYGHTLRLADLFCDMLRIEPYRRYKKVFSKRMLFQLAFQVVR